MSQFPMSQKRKYEGSQRGLFKKGKSLKKVTLTALQKVAANLGVESKYIDNHISSAAVVLTTAGAEQDPAAGALNCCATGDEPTMRNGRKIQMTSIQIHGHVVMAAISAQAAAWQAPAVRIIVYIDHQTNGVQCNSEDVLDDSAGTDFNSLRNVEYERRFTVLYDKDFMIPLNSFNDAATTGTVAGGAVPFRLYKKLDLPVTFVDGDADVAAIVDNSVHIMAISTTSNVKLHYISRIRFVG